MVSRRLRGLLALANRPGTEAEGRAAKAYAARQAAREGKQIVEGSDGYVVALDELHADLIQALRRVSGDAKAAGEINERRGGRT